MPPESRPPTPAQRLLHALLARRKVRAEQIPRIEEEMRRKRLPLEQVVIDLALVTERDLLEIRSAEIAVPFVDLAAFSPEPEVVLLIPEAFARKHALIALSREGTRLEVAAADPTDLQVTDTVRGFFRGRVEFRLAARGEILKKLVEYHDHYQALSVEKLLGATRDQSLELARHIGLKLENLDEVAAEQRTTIRVLNLLILHALTKRASDIHIEPNAQDLIVKYRIDGVLHQVQALPLNLTASLVSRIKVMCQMDIAERRQPQDGSFHITVEAREVAFRVSTVPTLHGEKVVMRILDKQAVLLGLENLGFSQDQYLRMRRLIQRPNGIIIVAGPTGSGKTTTLYSALMALNTGTRNITTIEDPIEYQIDGLTQIQVNEEIDQSFAGILRAVLRQDPDVILVGEIRDLDTTESAIRASLTGHLVFATLHTNDAGSAVTRLRDIGAAAYLLASSLRGVLSQRLVRALCHRCKEPDKPDPTLVALLPPRMQDLGQVWKAKGCRHCFMSGYRGRIPIMELLLADDRLRQLIVAGADSSALQRAAMEGGMTSMFEDGLRKIRAGLTTLEELFAAVDVPAEVELAALRVMDGQLAPRAAEPAGEG